MVNVKDNIKNINNIEARKVTQGHLKSKAEKNTEIALKLIRAISG
jgi:hypothetical protein